MDRRSLNQNSKLPFCRLWQLRSFLSKKTNYHGPFRWIDFGVVQQNLKHRNYNVPEMFISIFMSVALAFSRDTQTYRNWLNT